MGTQHWFLVPVLVLLLRLQLSTASHVIHENLDEAELAQVSVPAFMVSPLLKTGYHFQPRRNWINDNHLLELKNTAELMFLDVVQLGSADLADHHTTIVLPIAEDPNAPMYYKGWYHLFYQYNPKRAVWGSIVWAHSVSRDLITWMALEPALVPSIPSDPYGVWSGSASILHDGTPAILYTGVSRDDISYQVQNIAFPKDKSDPLLREWIKPSYNPIAVPEAGMNATLYRDPTTAWYSDGHWRMLLGGGAATARGALGLAYVYRSRDFRRWVRSKHPMHSATTGNWECTDFFPVAEDGEYALDTSVVSGSQVKYVLKNSLDLYRYDYYTIGTYNKTRDRYIPDDPNGDDRHQLRYDYGNFYASKTFYDPVKQRRILWGWANESDSWTVDEAKGWAGILAIPRKVWLHSSGKQLLQWPVEEVEQLRRKYVSVSDKAVRPGEHFEVTGPATYQADVEVTFEISSLEKAEPFDNAYANDAQKLCSVKGADVKGGVGPFGLWVLASGDLQEKTAIFFRVFKDGYGMPKVLMCTDPTKSSLGSDLYKPTFAGFVDTDIYSGRISLRTLIDRSVIESFGAGGKTCILSRVYPSIAIGKDAHLYVFNNGEVNIKVLHLTAWEMDKPLMNEAYKVSGRIQGRKLNRAFKF